MPIIFEPGKVVGDIEKELTRYRGCVAALESIIAIGGPRESDLEGAPVLEQFDLSSRAIICLAGQGRGHPRLGSQWTTTSPLIAIDAGLTAARTFSRWYRLEKPATELRETVARMMR